jgi:hypothetical protein
VGPSYSRGGRVKSFAQGKKKKEDKEAREEARAHREGGEIGGELPFFFRLIGRHSHQDPKLNCVILEL